MKPFFDTNILVYALSADPKRTRAQQLLDGGGMVGVQVLNELTNVLCKKLRRTWPEIEAALDDLCDLLEPPAPLSVATHQSARWLARDHGFGFYDALIVAAAIEGRLRHAVQRGHAERPPYRQRRDRQPIHLARHGRDIAADLKHAVVEAT